MNYNLNENAYLVTKRNMLLLQKILETEWEPLGYYIAAYGFNNIPAVNTRYNIIGKYIHANGKRLYFDDGEYVSNIKNKNLVDYINALITVE